jgi:ferredoxin
MKVVVDMNKCQDHGQCVFAAPDVFSMDEAGHLAYVSDPDEALRDQVEEAADVCPLQAIRIED